MKTIIFPYNKKRLSRLFCTFISLVAASIIFQGCDPVLYSSTGTYQTTTEVYRPDWAPVYDNNDNARYYYLPDIEAYYDLHTREYICLEDGNWVFTSILPYASFDIRSAFVVVLDNHVSQPWRHHQLYVSHYPRYYYRTVYNSPKYNYSYHDMRGFNENGRKDIFRNNYHENTAPQNPQQQYQQQYQRINNRSSSTGRQENISNNTSDSRRSTQQQDNRTSTQQQNNRNTSQQQDNSAVNQSQNNNRNYNQQTNRTQQTTQQTRPNNTTSENRYNQPSGTNTQQNQRINITPGSSETSKPMENPRRTQPAEYRGRTIGKPVKVQRDMRIQKETENKDNNAKDSDNKQTNSRR